MLTRGFALALALAGPPAEGGPSPDDARASAGDRLQTVVLAPDFSLPGLQSELDLRLHDRTIIDGGDPQAARTEPLVWVLVDADDPTTVRLRLITSDGRLFRRSLRADADEHARVVAGAVANMVDAIEQHRLQPAETGVAVPQPETPPDPDHEPEPAALPPESPTADVSDPKAAAPPPPQPLWIGGHLHPTVALGLGPPTDTPLFAGAGGTLGGDVFFRSHAFVRAAVRVAGTAAGGVSLTRVRVAVHGGYALRRRRFEFAALAGVAVEPLIISDPLQSSDGAQRNPAPLFAALLGLEPSVVVLSRPRKLELLVGPTFELGYGFEARRPAGTVRITRPDTSPLLRAGGLELAIAVGLQTRFAVGR